MNLFNNNIRPSVVSKLHTPIHNLIFILQMSILVDAQLVQGMFTKGYYNDIYF